LGLMVEVGHDTSYSSIGDCWVIPRTGWTLARTYAARLGGVDAGRLDVVETGVRGPPEEVNDIDEKVGEGVSG